jgi:Zn-dependent M28 family amino/carboxypeptidase
MIVDRFRELGLKPVNGSYVHTFSFVESRRGGSREFPDAANVIGMVAGTRDPASFVVLSAHYDHLGVRNGATYPGADDNASGVAAMLSLAGWFSAHPPARSILLVAFDGEEQGLQGARHFTARPPVDLKRITAVVNLDMIGRGDKNTLFVAGTRHYPALEPIVREAARGRALVVAFGHDGGSAGEDWTNSSDHGPFHAAGVPFLYFGVEDHADYHKPTDTAEKIPRAFYLEATRLVLDVVARLAG